MFLFNTKQTIYNRINFIYIVYFRFKKIVEYYEAAIFSQQSID